MSFKMAPERDEVGIVSIQGGLSRHDRLECQSRQADIQGTVLADYRSTSPKDRCRGRPAVDNVGSTPHPHVQDPCVLKHTDRLSQGRAAYPELTCHDTFRWKSATSGKASTLDCIEDLLDNFEIELLAFNASQRVSHLVLTPSTSGLLPRSSLTMSSSTARTPASRIARERSPGASTRTSVPELRMRCRSASTDARAAAPSVNASLSMQITVAPEVGWRPAISAPVSATQKASIKTARPKPL